MGAEVRILLQNDSVKSSRESTPKAPLVYKSHSCPELTEHKLSLVQRLSRDRAVTTPAPVTPPFFFLGRGGPNQTATSAQQADRTQEYTVTLQPKARGAQGKGEICFSQLEVELMTEP